MEQALETIGKMKAIVGGFQVDDLRVVATSAVREAVNGRAFCRAVRRRHGIQVEVISSEEEARLAFASVSRHFDLDGRPTAVVDIGGGSVEVVLAAGTAIEEVYWLPLGAVRVTEQYCQSDPLRTKYWKRLRRAIDRTVEERIGEPRFTAQTMIGSGGTFTTLAGMIQSELDQPFEAPQARVPLDPAQRPAGLLRARDRIDRQYRTVLSPRVSQEVAFELRTPRPCRPRAGSSNEQHSASGRRPGPHAHAVHSGRSVPPE